MRLSRLPAALVAAALLTGIVSCAATVEGTGTIAADVVAGGSSATPRAGTPTAGAPPAGTATDPMPTPAAPTTDPVVVKRRLLCVLEQATITSVNDQFKKGKDRAAQIGVLRRGATAIRGHLSRSGLPPTDGIRQRGQAVLDQLDRLVAEASKGGTPSTKPYNSAAATFWNSCNSVP